MLALSLWFLFEAICWVHTPGRILGGGPVTQAVQPRKRHHLGDRCTRPAGWRSIKALKPARSLYMLRGLVICKRCCLLLGPQGATAVFVPLLRGSRIYVLFMYAFVERCFSPRALDKMPRIVFISFKASFPCLKNKHGSRVFLRISMSIWHHHFLRNNQLKWRVINITITKFCVKAGKNNKMNEFKEAFHDLYMLCFFSCYSITEILFCHVCLYLLFVDIWCPCFG